MAANPGGSVLLARDILGCFDAHALELEIDELARRSGLLDRTSCAVPARCVARLSWDRACPRTARCAWPRLRTRRSCPIVTHETAGLALPGHGEILFGEVYVGSAAAGRCCTACLPLFHTNALNAFFQAVCAGATFVLGATVLRVPVLGRRARRGGHRHLPARGDGADPARPSRVAPQTPRTGCGSRSRPRRPRPRTRRSTSGSAVRLVEGYGSTETNMVLGAHPKAQRPGFMGVALGDHEVRVVDADGLDVPDGEPGELVCRSRQPFAYATGYFENPAATTAAYRDLWFHTGDRVVREPDGWLRFLDRLTDSIRRRGENISSLEVEQVLATHPAVAAVARLRGALGAGRGRGDGRRRPAPRTEARPGRAGRLVRSPGSRGSRSHATSTSCPSSRSPRTARSARRPSVSARSPRQRGTARPHPRALMSAKWLY